MLKAAVSGGHRHKSSGLWGTSYSSPALDAPLVIVLPNTSSLDIYTDMLWAPTNFLPYESSGGQFFFWGQIFFD